MLSTMLLFSGLTAMSAIEPDWNSANQKECDRACLIGIMDGYMDAIYKHDPTAVPPLTIDVRMTENTGVMNVGEGVLWRSKVEPTTFKIYVADPVGAKTRSWLSVLKSIGEKYRRSNSSMTVRSTMQPSRY
jgi:hypothetical protein